MASRRLTAVSAVLLTLGLSGSVAVPFLTQSASAAAQRVLDPGGSVEGCAEGETCEPPPEVTTTITTTPPKPPEVTITKTVTAKPPTPTRSKQSPKPTTRPPTTTQPAPAQQAPPPQLPATQPPTVQPTPTFAPTTPEPEVAFPTLAGEPTPSTGAATPTESNPLELKNAQPEVDQAGITQKLVIPALLLVLLALFGVLVFEGRLRRMAHAAAVRKAGPRQPEPAAAGFATGQPAHPGAVYPGSVAYPGNTAYAPIISLVPVQTYPMTVMPYYQDPYGQVHQQPQAAPYPYPQEPVPQRREPFEPAVPPGSDIPPGGDAPYREPPAWPAGAAEHGDPEPWAAPPSGPTPTSAPGPDPVSRPDLDPVSRPDPNPDSAAGQDPDAGTAVYLMPEPPEERKS